MSQLETNPLDNPTVRVELPTQIMQVKPAVQTTDFQFLGSPLLRQPSSNFSMQQLDWIQIAKKNKLIDTYTWNISSSDPWLTLHIDFAFIRKIIPIGLSFNAYANLTHLLISLKPTNNPFFRGLSILTFIPHPVFNYHNKLFGYPLTNHLPHLSQFQRVVISPKTSGEINMLIPLNFPFNFWKTELGSASNNRVANYMLTYQFGSLFTGVYSTLETTGTLTSLDYTLSAQVLDLSTAGLEIHHFPT